MSKVMARTGSHIEIDAIPVAIVIVGHDGTVLDANAAAAALFADSVTGASLNSFFPDEEDLHGFSVEAARDDSGMFSVHGRRANGVPFTANLVPGFTADGNLTLVLRELDRDELIETSAQMIHAAFDNSPIGMALFNTDGEYIRVNDALCRMLGRPAGELLGSRDQEITHPDDRQADLDAVWPILRGERDRHQTEKRFVRPDGEIVWVIANLTFIRDDRGRPISWLGQFQDITERKQAEQLLRQMADNDDLTGIPNRRRITRELATRVLHAGRYDERGAVLVLDLDGFKEVNDSLGHGAGDGILIAVAQALDDRLRSTDTLGRLGGDEFAVILPHATDDDAERVGRDLIVAVEQASGGAVTASCGVATYGPDATSSPEQLLANADRAMYRAKQGGRNAVVLGHAARG